MFERKMDVNGIEITVYGGETTNVIMFKAVI